MAPHPHPLHPQTSISYPPPPEPPCPLPCPGPITRRGPGTTSHLCPYTALRPRYEPATVSPVTFFSPLPPFSPSLCPFITAADPSQKEPSVATSLSFFSSSLCNRLAHFLPPTVPLSLSLRLAPPLTLPPLPPRREEITTVDSSCASRSCASFMRL